MLEQAQGFWRKRHRAIPTFFVGYIWSNIIFTLTPLFGFSYSLIWTAFLTFPFAVFQIIQIRALANGNPPNWKLLTSTALAVFGLTVYLLIMTFWLR